MLLRTRIRFGLKRSCYQFLSLFFKISFRITRTCCACIHDNYTKAKSYSKNKIDMERLFFVYRIIILLNWSSACNRFIAIHAVNDGSIFFSGEVGQALEEYQKYSKTKLPLLTSRERKCWN